MSRRRHADPRDRRLSRRVARIRALVAVSLLLLGGAAVLGVVLAGRVVTATDDGLTSAVGTLDQATELATTLADVSSRIAALSTTVGTGVGQTGQVLDTTGSLAGSVRKLVEIVAPLSKNLSGVADELATTEATLQQLRAQIGSTQQQVASAAPDLARATASLADLPRRLTAERDRIGGNRTQLHSLLWLLRAVIALVALVIGGLLLSAERNASLVLAAHRQGRYEREHPIVA